jgi:hypothetical protein
LLLKHFKQSLKKTKKISVIVSPAFHFLNQANSTDIYTALSSLRKIQTDDKTNAIAIFILDTTLASKSMQF